MKLLPILLLVALALAACNGAETPPLQVAMHLDPSPSGTGSNARAALDATATGAHTAKPAKHIGSLAPWTYSGPPSQPMPGTGLHFPGGEWGAPVPTERPPTFTLELPGPLDFDCVELDIDLAGNCTAQVVLHFEDGTQTPKNFWIPARPSRAPLELFTGWQKPSPSITSIDVTPSADQPRALKLYSIQLAKRSLSVPTNPPLSASSGDEGLRKLASPAARVWPSTTGRTLVSNVTVPGPARLWTRAWIPPGGRGQAFPTIHARVETESDSIQVYGPTLANLDLAKSVFHDIEIDLADFAGKDITLEFNSTYLSGQGGSPNPPPGPGLGVLFETPMLLPPASTPNPPGRPNIILVTFDTTRADFAANKSIAPNLDALAQTGLNFTNAWSPSNTTTPAHASIFTGLMPHDHGALAVGSFDLAERVSTMAEVLRDQGYATAGFTSVEHIDAAHGFAQGFDLFMDGSLAGSHDGNIALSQAQDFLENDPRTDAPFFIWIHWFDPHTPYQVPDSAPPEFTAIPFADVPQTAAPGHQIPGWARDQKQLQGLPRTSNLADLQERYARGVQYTDWLLGQFLDTLKTTGHFDESLITITADHGEALGEQNIFASHVSLLPPVLRIPLVVKLPANFPASSRPSQALQAAPVSSRDILPTILDITGIDHAIPDSHSLLQPDPARTLWFESDRLTQAARLDNGIQLITTLRATHLYNGSKATGYKGLGPGHAQAFDVVADPLLENDLIPSGQAPDSTPARLVETAKHALQSSDSSDLDKVLSPTETDRLKDLGYL